MDPNVTVALIRALYLAALGVLDSSPDMSINVAMVEGFLSKVPNGAPFGQLTLDETEELRELLDAYRAWRAAGGFRSSLDYLPPSPVAA